MRLNRLVLAGAAICVLLPACSESPVPGGSAADAVAIPVPAAAGSLGARLTAGQDGSVLLSWLEPSADGHALRLARWRDAAWTTPATVASGDDWFANWADFPSVVPIDDRFWVAHWLKRRPAGGYAYDVQVTISRNGGASWSDALSPHRDGTDTEHGFVSIYPVDGAAGLVWLDGRDTAGGHGAGEHGGDNGGMTLRAATLARDASLTDEAVIDNLTCDCCPTAVTVTDAGPLAVYRDRTEGEVRDVYAARHVDGQWQPGEPVAHDGWTISGCPVNGPVAASAGSRVAVAWFTQADNTPRVRLARTDDVTAGFGPPLDVGADPALGRVGLALLDNGTAIVSWLRSDGDGTAELRLTPVSANGDIGPDYAVANNVLSNSVPQLVRDGDALLVVWTTRNGEASALGGARVPLDRII